ncbi:hypothetical protein [Halomarina litorea]|uniref:hypothetical protein n=1 Tax=Halomarina litorea TaxID=2961595 RepID=UPI0020C3F2CD|nr:hypothetical protein [Halomarina sp. BCD28]
MQGGTPNPADVRSLAITVDDVVSAVEARRNGRPVVLRVTPPFHARMRARIHLAAGEGEERDDPDAVHLDPTRLLAPSAPDYPTPAETEDRLRASDEEYTREVHHDHHREAVEAWREAVRDHLVADLTFETPDGPHTVRVKPLG